MPAASHASAPAAVPAPLPFPRGPFAAALQHHARLLDGALEDLVAIVREYDGDLDSRIDLLCAHVEVGPDRHLELGTQPRMMEASEFPLHAALQLALAAAPESLCMSAVVVARGTVSLHVLRAVPAANRDRPDDFRLEVAARDLLVEPLAQERRARGPWTVTRWLTPGGEAHWAWVRTPPPPTPAGILDALVARNEARLEERARAAAKRGIDEPVLLVRASPRSGDMITIFDRSSPGVGVACGGSEAILTRLENERHRGLVPLCVSTEEYDGLRWLDQRADRTKPHAAPEITLEKARSREASGEIDPELAALEKELEEDVLHPDPEPVDDRPMRAQTGPRFPLSVADAIDRVVIDGYWAEIEEVLAMAPEEMDAAIARAGFDAAEERRTGFMLREKVLAAVVRGRDVEAERE